MVKIPGRVNYINGDAPNPTTYYIDPPAGVPICNVVDDPRDVLIMDARDITEPLDLDTHGFCFVKLPTDFQDFDDQEAIREQLYPAMEQLTRDRLPGKSYVVASDHAVRRQPKPGGALRGSGVLRQPLHRVHCDLTPTTAKAAVTRLMGEKAEEVLSRRFAIVNYWRPITGPLRDDPLGIIDPRSVSPEDLVKVRHVYEAGDGEIFGVRYNPAHRWFYMSDMQPDDAIMFKVYDSGTDRPLVGPHTAFPLINAPRPVPPRESFEFRLLVVD